MDTLNYILEKFNILYPEPEYCADEEAGFKPTKMPIEIPNFGREGMAKLFGELGFKKGVEIGVRGGDYSLTLMESIPDLELYGIDPYMRIPGYRDITKQTTFEGFEAEAHKKLDKFPKYHFIKKLSLEAVDQFEDNSLDFVYIDGNHDFFNVTADIESWIKKIKKSGIISGDDYFKHKGNARIQVYYVVNGYTEAWQIKPWFVLGSKAMIPGEVRDHGRSWMWVKR